ncbi:hypothetical protein O181_001338 [Austropuccinia psidii MF-1]|uniref:Uncharacterized protein n=1 Tax=Austropuccinia psidii MF-1 TaxID=1389203 RepID=A0A9Q3BAK5_9BASI|nr:hypothetical protein [Austropuccinia psidii MF-1]
MNQQLTSDLPPLPEDTVEGQYAEESEDEDQTVQIQSPMKQMQDLSLKKEKRKGKEENNQLIHLELVQVSPHYQATEPRTQNIPRSIFVTTPNNPSPLQQKVPRQERPVVKIKAKYYNLNFNEEVEKFIKKVERIAHIEGATDKELAMEIEFLDNRPKEDGGIGILSQYKKFMGKFETIATYLLRDRYIPQDNMFHEDLFYCLSADIKGAINKEMIKDNVMLRTEDEGYLIPHFNILNKYIEQELEARILVTKIFSSNKGRNVTEDKEKKVQFKKEAFPGMNETFNKMKEITESLKEQKLETRNQAQG